MTENGTRSGYGAMGIAFAFLGGALAGAGAALLLAPRSGAETRKRIGDAVQHSGDQVARTRAAAAEAASAARQAFAVAMREEH
jgi:gas vesicle protein